MGFKAKENNDRICLVKLLNYEGLVTTMKY